MYLLKNTAAIAIKLVPTFPLSNVTIFQGFAGSLELRSSTAPVSFINASRRQPSANYGKPSEGSEMEMQGKEKLSSIAMRSNALSPYFPGGTLFPRV